MSSGDEQAFRWFRRPQSALPDGWPDDPWARSSRERASLQALEHLGDRLSPALQVGAAELLFHRGRVDDALRDNGLAGPDGPTARERARASELRTAELGA